MASAKLKAAVKRIKGTLDRNYETSVTTPTAGPVGSGKLFIGGQVFDGDISGVTQVVNVGRPAAAQYAAKYGGSGGTTVVSGGSSTASVTLSSTPGTLSATTINDASGSHTHAIDASAAPGAAEYLLKSSSAGNLTLPTFTASTSITTPSLLSVGDLTITPAVGDIFANALLDVITGASGVTKSASYSGIAVHSAGNTGVQLLSPNTGVGLLTFGDTDDNDVGRILYRHSSDRLDFETGGTLRATLGSTYTWDVTGTMRATTSLTTPLLTTATNVDLIINPAGTGAVQFPNDQTLRTTSFDSSFPITGWQINEVSGVSGYSSLTIGKIQADELAVRVFVADEVRVDRGDEYWTKSYGIVATTFTTPSTIGGTVSVKFEDSPALAGAIFTNNDWVLIRKLDIDTGITLSNVWGQVATYVNNSDGTQNWTFTLRSGPTSESITKGSLAIDFGASGAALIHLSVIDSAGAPYIKMRKWAGANPYTPSNFTTYIQLGNLNSTGNSYYTPSGYGLYIRSTAAEDQFMVADDNGLQIRGPSISLYNSTTQTILMNNTSGINVREDVWGSWDNRRALQWWPDVASMSGDPSLSVYTGKVVGGLTANQNFSYIDANPTGNVLAGLSITAFGQGTATDATLYLEGGSQSLTTTPSITMTATNIDMIGAVDVTGSLSVGGTAVSLNGHTHSYLPLSGGTLTGTLITDIMRPATNNTKTVGTSSYFYDAGYFNSLYVNTIVGTPSYSHTHSASDITSGTLDFARMATTWTGALTMDADAAGGNSNYIRWLTQTSTIKAWDLIGRAHDYATTAQQNDLLLTYTDNTTTYIVFQADNATRIIDFLNTPTVGGTAVSLSGHMHDDRYYTETEVNSLLSGYVPTSRTVTAGSGLTGGGALSANITLNLDTPGSLSVSSSNSASGNHAHAITASSAPGAATSLLKSDTSGNLTLPTFAASTSVTTPLLIATNRLGISTGTSGVTESTAYNGVYVHAASNAAIQLLTPNTSVGLVTFGDPEDNDIGRILYRHSTNVLDLEAGASLRLRLGGATYAADVTGALRATGAIYADAGMTTSTGNLALTSAGGTVAVTGALTGSSTGVFTSTLTAASDTDAINTFGRVRLGYSVATDTATFSHFDHNSSTNFALSQSAAGATVLNAASGQTISLGNAGSATVTVSASGIDLQSGKHIGSYNYASQSAGWRVDSLGGGDFRYLYADQLHVKAFIADLEQALAGGQIISKSVAVLASDFVAPYAGGTQLLTVEDLPSASNMPVFEANDIVAMRSFSRASGTLSVAYCFGTVTGYTDGTGVQTWTFTRSGTTTYNTITIVGAATSSTSSGATSRSVTKPTGVSSGHVMIATVAHDGAADTITATGWTSLGYTSGTDINVGVFYKVAGGSEGASYTFSTVSSHAIGASIIAYSNVSTTAPIDAFSIQANASGTSMPAPAAWSSSTAGKLVFVGGVTNNTAITPPGGMTEQIDTGSTGIRVYMADETLSTSGSNTRTATIASAFDSVAASIVLRPTYSSMSGSAGQVAPGTTIEADTLVLDFGVAGNGFYEVSAVDGTYGANSPYARVVTYATHPFVDGVVRAQMGNLGGLSGATAGEYGLYAGSGTIGTTAQYMRISTAGVQLNNIPIKLYNAGTQTVNIDSAGTDIWIGPSSSDKRLSWNGTTLAFKDSDVSLYTAGTKVVGLNPTYGLDFKLGSAYTDEIPTITWRATAGAGSALARISAYQAASETGIDIRVQPADSAHNGSTSIAAYNYDGSNVAGIAFETPAVGTTQATVSIYGNIVEFVSNPLTVTLTHGDLDMNGNDIIDIGNVTGNIGTWTTLTLNTGGSWANYGGSYFNAAYKKIGDLVFLRGLVKRTSGTNTLIATMPVGYRPTSYVLRSTSGDDAFARIDIENDGEMRMQAGTAAAYISLDGLWFSTA